jgi:hypothetical protein
MTPTVLPRAISNVRFFNAQYSSKLAVLPFHERPKKSNSLDGRLR